jgi:hypothetical protein
LWLLIACKNINFILHISEKRVEGLLDVYGSSYDSNLGLEEFRDYLLQNLPNLDTVFLFSYALARLLRLREIPSYALSSGFAGQLELNLLFDITLVIDKAIKAKNPEEWRFIDHAAFLSQRGDLGLSKDDLRSINREFQENFDSTLEAILDNVFEVTGYGNIQGLTADLAIAYGMRNRGAHDVTSASTVWQRFEDVQQSLFNALFFVAEVLY